jgi:hypothetical protein
MVLREEAQSALQPRGFLVLVVVSLITTVATAVPQVSRSHLPAISGSMPHMRCLASRQGFACSRQEKGAK